MCMMENRALKTTIIFFEEISEGFMEIEKRKEYFIFTNIFWWIGFIIYGGLAIAGKDLLKIPLNIFSFFPYGIYNFISWKKEKRQRGLRHHGKSGIGLDADIEE